jgi:hypothetical protein
LEENFIKCASRLKIGKSLGEKMDKKVSFLMSIGLGFFLIISLFSTLAFSNDGIGQPEKTGVSPIKIPSLKVPPIFPTTTPTPFIQSKENLHISTSIPIHLPPIILTPTKVMPPLILPQPVLLNPVNGWQTNDPHPTLSWENVTGATYYKVQIAHNSSFTNLTQTVSALTDTSYTVNTLVGDGLWYWHIRAFGPGKISRWSATRSFTLDITPPAVPKLINPLNMAICYQIPLFRWSVVPGATTYQFRLLPPIYYTSVINTTTNTYRPNYMDPGRYDWSVRAQDAAGNWSNWSQGWILTMKEVKTTQ